MDTLNDRVRWFTGDSENDLKINIFLAAGESDVDADLDLDADTDVVFKDPALFYDNHKSLEIILKRVILEFIYHLSN